MTLQSQINAELNRLASGGAAKADRCLSLSVEGGQLECKLVAVENLACAYEWIALRTNRLADASVTQLRQAADALSSRLSYLFETISPIEMDRESHIVQLRSQPPTYDEQGTCYYELLVRRGEIRLCRYGKSRGEARRSIPATVTREVLLRTATDLVESVA